MEIWRRKRGFAEASEREREVLIQNSSAPHFLPHYILLLANLSFEGFEGRGGGGGFFRSHQYVRRHSRIRNLLSSWELPNMAGNSLNVPNGEYFIFYKM